MWDAKEGAHKHGTATHMNVKRQTNCIAFSHEREKANGLLLKNAQQSKKSLLKHNYDAVGGYVNLLHIIEHSERRPPK